MPAGTDIITFAPRTGSSGDNRYSTPANTRWAFGSSTFTAPPAVTEINASTHYNQIIGELNRRRFEFSLAARTYVAQNDRITASRMSALKTDIDTQRSTEGLSAFTWTATFTAGQSLKIQHILELRKALAIDYILLNLPNYEDDHAHLRATNNFYPPTTISDQGQAGDAPVGQFTNGISYQKSRFAYSLTFPALPSISTASLRINVSSVIGSPGSISIYQNASYENPITAASWHTNAGLGSDALLASAITLSAGFNDITLGGFTFTSGGSVTIIFLADRDVANTAPSGDERYLINDESNLILKLYT